MILKKVRVEVGPHPSLSANEVRMYVFIDGDRIVDSIRILSRREDFRSVFRQLAYDCIAEIEARMEDMRHEMLMANQRNDRANMAAQPRTEKD